MGRKLKDTIISYIFLAPFLIIFSIFLGFPLIYSLYLSFRTITPSTYLYNAFSDMKFVGFENYIRLLKDPEFWWSLIVSFEYAVIYITLLVFVSLILAVILNQELKFKNLYRSGFFLPNLLDVFVVGIIWSFLYAPQFGLISGFFSYFGFKEVVEKGILGMPQTAILGVIIMLILKNAGFGMILFLSALQNIPEDIYEAAEIDGANAIQKFFKITLPLVRPVILFIVITGTIGALNAFAEVYATTGGGPITTFMGKTVGATKLSGFYLFTEYRRMNFGYAASISYALLIVTLIISIINAKLLKPKV